MSRSTRSGTVPEWSLQEMLTLVLEIAAVDDECGTIFSSHQKWEIVSDHLVALDVRRNSYQCRRKWDALLSEYKAIKDSESGSGGGGRTGTGLPAGFDRELFGLIDDVIMGRKKGKGGGGGGGMVVEEEEKKKKKKKKKKNVEAEVEDMLVDFVVVDSSDSHEVKDGKGKNILERLQEKATYLEENVEQIEAILRGDLSEDTRITCTLADHKKPNAMETAFTRQQADELIKVFGSLITTLDQLK